MEIKPVPIPDSQPGSSVNLTEELVGQRRLKAFQDKDFLKAALCQHLYLGEYLSPI